MGWVDGLRGQLVGLDTSSLIYFIETNPTYLPLVDPLFTALGRGEFTAATSTVTLVEVLTRPLQLRDVALAQRYRDLLLGSTGLKVESVSPKVAEEAARFRANRRLRTPDALQLATVVLAGAQYFVTNDARLVGIPGLETIVLDRLVSDH